jgi:multidrug efflux pump subunit AcrA (membrane-fusion protein)
MKAMTNMNKKNWIVGGAVLAAVAIAAGVVGCSKPSAAVESAAAPVAAATSRPALTVRTTTLRDDKWGRSLAANGSILPWQEAIISAQIAGLRIAEVKVSIGDYVQQGQVLVTLDNFASALDSDPAHAPQGRIVAPDSGIISATNANVGSMLQPGTELFRLIRKSRLEWKADLTAEELMLLRKGMSAEVVVGEGRVIKGTIRAISPSVNAQTRYGYALVSLPNSQGVIAGAYARGSFDITGGKKRLASLPQSAVMQRGAKTYVLHVGADNRVNEHAVVIGQRVGDRIEIKQGLKADELVVESGGAFLTEGDVVQVVK